MGGPSLNHQLPIHPDPDPVVADGADPVGSRRESHRRGGLEPPVLDGQLRHSGPVPLEVDPGELAGEQWRGAGHPGKDLGAFGDFSAVGPGEEPGGPAGGRLEAAVAEAVRGAGGPGFSAGRAHPAPGVLEGSAPVSGSAWVTERVSHIRPDSADSRATARRPTIRQRPAGPSTARRSGTARLLSTGQSLGDFQSKGPHSSTIMAERSRSANGDAGIRAMASGSEGTLPAYPGGRVPGRQAREATAIESFPASASPVVLAACTVSRLPAKRFFSIR